MIVTATETAIAIVTATVTVTGTAVRIVNRVRAIMTLVSSHVLTPDRLTIPDADATVSKHDTVALSFWLTEGKGNDKLNFGTSQKARPNMYLQIGTERFGSEERQK